ncbi:hypothetical protein P0G10_20785, partial [Eubacteriales bacterium DFI.9.88]|nr:hypothetical protein [Eubacteriales bacterium DFI.9.88]
GSKKAKVEKFITKFARYYTPIVVIAAALMAVILPLAIPGQTFSDWISRALIFLVISCPCALVISVPLAFFGGKGLQIIAPFDQNSAARSAAHAAEEG